MAANVETMFYTRTKPWHGLGTMVEEAATSWAALELAVHEYQIRRNLIPTNNIAGRKFR